MQNQSKNSLDLIIILTVTLGVNIIYLPFFPLDIAIKNFLSVIFLLIPGYAVMTFIFPVSNFSIIKKLFFSFIISMGILIVIAIIEYIISGYLINKQSSLVIILSLLTVISIILALIRRKRNLDFSEDNYIICQNCNGYYKLEYGEKIEDFKVCECGGKFQKSSYVGIESRETSKKLENNEGSNLPLDIILIFVASIISILISFTPVLNGSILLTVIALPFLVLLPGYSLIAALYPKKDDLEGTERAALSFGISVLIAPIIGLILNYTPFGIKLVYILIILAIFTIIMNAIAYIKRQGITKEDRFIFRFKDYISRD